MMRLARQLAARTFRYSRHCVRLRMWRQPLTDHTYDWTRPELYRHIAKLCEPGRFGMVFLADRPRLELRSPVR